MTEEISIVEPNYTNRDALPDPDQLWGDVNYIPDLRPSVLYLPPDMGTWSDKWGYVVFGGTPFEVYIKARGRMTRDECREEVNKLSSHELESEPFQHFFRHADMISRVGTPDSARKFLPTAWKRIIDEAEGFMETVYPENPNLQELMREDTLNYLFCILELYGQDRSNNLSPDKVEELYKMGMDKYPKFIRTALRFDTRNKILGQSIGLSSRIKDLLESRLLDEDKEGKDDQLDLLMKYISTIDSSVLLHTLVSSLAHSVDSEKVIEALAPRLGIEQIRKTLREYAESNENFMPKLQHAYKYMGIDSANDVALNLENDVYNKLDFSLYKPNEQLQNFEERMLEDEFKDKKILDVACGTGRHILANSSNAEMNVSGIDIVQKHVEYIKNKNPDTHVQVASWFDMPFPDNSYDGMYCLGRSFTHNTTIPDAVACLREMRRVLRDDGVVILDLPDPAKGEYKDLINQTREISKSKRLKVLKGLINDSPDQKHYFDRFAPDEHQFKRIAELAGFKAEKFTEKPYRGVSEEENLNTYWRLTKQKELPIEVVMDWRMSEIHNRDLVVGGLRYYND